ncbi:hypothetical protein ACFLYI_00820 [Chloroflexota bacterium]
MEELGRFYGYSTLHVLKDGQIYDMLSVDEYTEQVWYHSSGFFISTNFKHFSGCSSMFD